MAPATTVQLQQAAVALNSAPAALKADVAAAGPTLRPFLITLMCVQDDSATRGLVQRYVGSRGTAMFNGWSGMMAPGKQHHRARPPAGSVRKKGARDQAAGRSRGGLTTRVHMLADTFGRPLRFRITPGQASNRAGLAAYLFTRDIDRSWRVPEVLDYGMVGLNTGLISTEVAPFGGVRESGMGREGSIYGVDDYLDPKLVCAAVG